MMNICNDLFVQPNDHNSKKIICDFGDIGETSLAKQELVLKEIVKRRNQA